MADSLDDFFAKKDKKRSKDKSKSTLSSKILGKELEEGSKQLDYPIRKEAKTSTAIEILGLDADDADWRDFEDIEKRDYTGLKVKEMSLQDQTDDDQRRLSADQTEVIPESTPWKLKDEQQQQQQQQSSLQQPSATAPSATASNNEQSIFSNDVKQQSQSKITTADEDHSNKAPADTTNKTSDTAASSSDTPTPATDQTDKKDQDEKIDDAKKGDGEKTGDKVEKKKAAYVPPQARLQQMDGEVKNLEPIRLGKSKLTHRGQELKLNIQDEKAFPSLG